MADSQESMVRLIAGLTADRVIIQALLKCIAAADMAHGAERSSLLATVLALLTSEQARFSKVTMDCPPEYAETASIGYQKQFAEVRKLAQKMISRGDASEKT